MTIARSRDAERTRFPLVDGARSVAHISLLLMHCTLFSTVFAGTDEFYASWAPGAFAFGVLRDVGAFATATFFVLSGFLATVAITQHTGRRDGRFWARFYANRIIRFSPMLWLAVFASMVFPDPIGRNVYWWRPLLFLQNCVHRVQCQLNPANHTWTTATDFQFYLLLPLLLPFVHALGPASRRGAFGAIAAACCALSAVRLYGVPLGHPFERPTDVTDVTRAKEVMVNFHAQMTDFEIWYFSPWARLPEFLAGIMLALDYLEATRDPRRRQTSRLATAVAAVAVVLLSCGSFGRGLQAWPDSVHRVYRCASFPVFGWAVAQLLRHLLMKQLRQDASLPGWILTRSRPWRFIADVSYASYCIHMITLPIVFVTFAEATHRQTPITLGAFLLLSTVGILVTFAISALLHHNVELPLFRWLKPAAFRLIDGIFFRDEKAA